MRLSIAFCLIALLAGCSRHTVQTGDPTIVPPKRLDNLVRADRERMAGIDAPRHLKHTYLGVDVTDENPFDAMTHVVGSLWMRVYRFTSRDTPLKTAAKMENPRDPDARREGMMELVQSRFARKDPYTKRYSQIAENDPEYLVRAAAIRALNYSRRSENADLFVRGLDAPDPLVRLEAAKAIANIPVEKAIPRLIAILQKDEDKDVRIACADALRNYKTVDVARALAAVMTDRDFGVSWQAHQSLVLMTGRDFRYDEAAWLDYLSRGSKPFIS